MPLASLAILAVTGAAAPSRAGSPLFAAATDPHAGTPETRACGRVPLERGSYLFARGQRGDGVEGWFIVDLAASETIVERSFVPERQAIEPLGGTEYSSAGVRRLRYGPAGATDSIETVVGRTVFPSLAFGTLNVARARVTVLERMPDVFGRPVAGILGIDVLRGCGRLVLDLAPAGPPVLTLAAAAFRGRADAVTPFRSVGAHVMVSGSLERTPALWILDTGSPGTVVDSSGAPPLAAAEGGPESRPGLAGPGIAPRHARAAALRVGALEHRDVPCEVTPLGAFASLREPGHALGVLGLAEIARASRIEVDFRDRVVRWFR